MKSNSNFLTFAKNFKISKNFRIWLAVPIAVILITIAVIVGLGETLTGGYSDAVGIGIDFEGGTKLTVNLSDIDENAAENYDALAQSIKNKVESFGVNVSYVQKTVSDSNGDVSVQLRYKNISNSDEEIANLNVNIRDAVDQMYPDVANSDYHFITYESVSATAAQNLLSSAGIAVGVSVALILVYIIFRFTFVSGIAAILALVHDVVIMFCLTVWCRNIPINTSYVAAMVTIVAYSINNTIIIFDRVREMMKPLKGQKNIDYDKIGDDAVKATMRRSLFTTLTTLVTVFFLAVLGGDSMQEFCVPIILGLVAGFFSSVFLATPMWAGLSRAWDKMTEKYKAKHGAVVYDDKNGDAAVAVASADVVTDDSTVQKAVGGAKEKQQKAKAKANATYKYNKKNTTFKKKK